MKHLDSLPMVFIVAIFLLFSTACVSVNLPSKEVVPSADIKLQAPTKPFEEMAMPEVQHAWKSSTTSNIISVISNCSPSSDPALETLETDAKSALDNYVSLESHEVTFNERKAIRSLVKGEVDGVAVMLDVLVMKKNGCRYTLSYSGRMARFNEERNFFDYFLSGFKVP